MITVRDVLEAITGEFTHRDRGRLVGGAARRRQLAVRRPDPDARAEGPARPEGAARGRPRPLQHARRHDHAAARPAARGRPTRSSGKAGASRSSTSTASASTRSSPARSRPRRSRTKAPACDKGAAMTAAIFARTLASAAMVEVFADRAIVAAMLDFEAALAEAEAAEGAIPTERGRRRSPRRAGPRSVTSMRSSPRRAVPAASPSRSSSGSPPRVAERDARGSGVRPPRQHQPGRDRHRDGARHAAGARR